MCLGKGDIGWDRVNCSKNGTQDGNWPAMSASDNVPLLDDRYGTGIGVWLSPWGGYGEAKESRLAAAREHG